MAEATQCPGASPRVVRWGSARRGMAQAASRRRQRRRSTRSRRRAPTRSGWRSSTRPSASRSTTRPARSSRSTGRCATCSAATTSTSPAWSTSVDPDERPASQRPAAGARRRARPRGLVAEHRLVRPDGTRVRVRLHVTATHDRARRDRVARDPRGGRHRAAERTQELLHQTLHDPLTGLPNRTLLHRPARPRAEPVRARRGRRASRCCSSTSTTSSS